MVRAAVLERFDSPLELRDFPEPSPDGGRVVVEVTAAGVCGSDVHMWKGEDARTPLPIILGHEGAGRLVAPEGLRDVRGRDVRPGDPVIWDRGVTCGKCVFCAVKRQSFLCRERKVYGINMSCAEEPHLLGCYAEKLRLLPGTRLLRLPEGADLPAAVSASCSGATAAHAMENAVEPNDVVVVMGAGPLGSWCAAFAREGGAREVVVTDIKDSRLTLARSFGATVALNIRSVPAEERRERVLEMTGGLLADVVVEAAGNADASLEALSLVRPGGKVVYVGPAVSIGETPIRFFEDVARKNLELRGVWVSDTSHLDKAVALALSGRYPFEKMVTHTFGLEDATEALRASGLPGAVKVVIEPCRR